MQAVKVRKTWSCWRSMAQRTFPQPFPVRVPHRCCRSFYMAMTGWCVSPRTSPCQSSPNPRRRSVILAIHIAGFDVPFQFSPRDIGTTAILLRNDGALLDSIVELRPAHPQDFRRLGDLEAQHRQPARCARLRSNTSPKSYIVVLHGSFTQGHLTSYTPL